MVGRMDGAILPTKPKIYQWRSWTDTMDGRNVLLVTTRLSKERFVAFFQEPGNGFVKLRQSQAQLTDGITLPRASLST